MGGAKTPALGSSQGGELRVAAPEAGSTAARSRAQVLVPTASNKRVQGSDFHLGVFLQAIWFDIAWDTSNLKRPTAVVKGFVVIGDAAGEPKLRFLRVMRTPLRPGQEHFDEGIGFEYDESDSSHRWVRTTDLKDMTFRFEATEIVYQDGSLERF